MGGWWLADRALALAGVGAAMVAAGAGLAARPRAALASVEAAAVLFAASLVALAVAVGPTDLLLDVPADALSRMAAVLGLLGVRNLLGATDAPETRALVARVAVPLLLPAGAMTAAALWAWLGWAAPVRTRWGTVVPAAAVAMAVAGVLVRRRVRRIAEDDAARARAVTAAIADRGR